MIFRTSGVALAAALALGLVGATTFTAAADDSVLQSILSTHQITIGLGDSGAPFNSVDASGNHGGFDVDLANALAKSLGATPNMVQLTGAGRVAALQTKQVQVIVANFTQTAARAQTISFSGAYLLPKGYLMVKTGSKYAHYEDFNTPDAKICVGQGGTAATVLPLTLPKASIVTLNSLEDCVQAVLTGQADATSESQLKNYAIKQAQPGQFTEITDGEFNTAVIAVGLQFNDLEMKEYVNAFIADEVGNGQMQALFAKWWPGYEGAPPLSSLN
jgi:ABC-type amino acid transport substrate-binding protein